MKLLLSFLVIMQISAIICDGNSSSTTNDLILKKKKHKIECTKRLNEFSDFHKNFIQCALKNGAPIQICEKCLNKFVNSTILYHRLTTTYNDTNCYEHFFDHDRINVVSSIYADGLNLWNRAYCKDCYEWHDYTMNLNFSMETKNVLNHLNTTRACIKKHYGEACAYCSAEYLNLNDLFISMEKQKKSQICFDIQDAMNKTRILWSKEMKCCDERESSLLSFTLLSTVFSVIIVMFYIAVPFFEIRRQSNTILPNQSTEESQPSGSSDSNAENQGNIITGFAIPTPSTRNPKLRVINDDSSDDEILVNSPRATREGNLIDVAAAKLPISNN